MFADLLVRDDPAEDEVEETLSDEAQIRDRIMALDGENRTLVTLYGGDAHLAVGGDSATGLVVYATFDNEVFHQLTTGAPGSAGSTGGAGSTGSAGSSDEDGDVTVTAGGQPGEYPAHHVVGAEDAVTAATQFARDGSLAAGLEWTQN